MKINSFRRRCLLLPRNKRDRNSGNSALRVSRGRQHADGILHKPECHEVRRWCRAPIDLWTCARGRSWTARRGIVVDQVGASWFTGLSMAATSSSAYNTSFLSQQVYCIAQSGVKQEFIRCSLYFIM